MKLFEHKAIKKAEKLGTSSTQEDLNKIESNLNKMNKGPVAKIWEKVLFLWEKVKSPEIPLRLKITIIGALLYLILPIDVIPDSIPGLGLVDDVSVILWVFREVSNYVVPLAVEKIKQQTEESLFNKIDEVLLKKRKEYLSYSLICLILNVTGCLLLIFKPFENISRALAIGVFSITIVWSLARFINPIYTKHELIEKFIKSFKKSKSLKKATIDMVVEKYPVIAKVYAGIELAQQFIPSLSSVPDLEEIADDFIKHYRKLVITTAIIVAAYGIFFFVLKFYLLGIS